MDVASIAEDYAPLEECRKFIFASCCILVSTTQTCLEQPCRSIERFLRSTTNTTTTLGRAVPLASCPTVSTIVLSILLPLLLFPSFPACSCQGSHRCSFHSSPGVQVIRRCVLGHWVSALGCRLVGNPGHRPPELDKLGILGQRVGLQVHRAGLAADYSTRQPTAQAGQREDEGVPRRPARIPVGLWVLNHLPPPPPPPPPAQCHAAPRRSPCALTETTCCSG